MRRAFRLFLVMGFSLLQGFASFCSAEEFSDAAPAARAGAPIPSASPTASKELDWSTLSPDTVKEAFALLRQNPSSSGKLTVETRDQFALRSILKNDPANAQILTRMELAQAQPAALPLVVPLTSTSVYLRPGRLSSANAAIMTKSLRSQPVEITTLILDLRAPAAPQPLAPAGRLLSLFFPDKTPLFTLEKNGNPELVSTSGIRCWDRRLWILVDSETPNDLELAARILIKRPGTRSFGSPPSGKVLEYCELALGSSHILLVPAAVPISADGSSVWGHPLRQEFPIAGDLALKHHLFSRSDPAGFLPALRETDLPHLNEAALMAGSDPELPARLSGPSPMPLLPDPVMQQVLDLLETTAFLKLDAAPFQSTSTPGQ